MNQAVERIESIKAGTIGAIAATGVHGSILLLSLGLICPPLSTPSIVPMLVSAALAACSGFLFGVTYRYIIRQDSNVHLKQGAILAFGFVRSVAKLEATLSSLKFSVFPDGITCLESFLMFATAAIALELAMQKKWLKSFPG